MVTIGYSLGAHCQIRRFMCCKTTPCTAALFFLNLSGRSRLYRCMAVAREVHSNYNKGHNI